MQNPLLIVRLVSLLIPFVADVIKATRPKSAGGKKITKAEWKKIAKAIGDRLGKDDVWEAVGEAV